MVARYYGAGKERDMSETVHSAILLSLLCGGILLVVGILVAPQILIVMGTPADVLGQAVLYIRIYFAGIPALLLYNFGSSILRAVGDTKRPLYYLLAAGVINVFLNLIFVIGFRLGVAGVALATVISQCVSALLVLRCMMRMEGGCRVELSKLRINREKMLQSMRIGSVAVAGNTAGQNIEGFIYMAMNTFHQTALSFSSQNYGAGNYKRIGKVFLECLGLVTFVGLSLGLSAYFFGSQLLGIYSSDPQVIEVGLLRMSVICTMYCLCGIMDVCVGELRGIGCSVLPMAVSVLGVCAFRVFWIFTVFQQHRSLWTLYISYPVSWVLTAAVDMVCFVLVRRKQKAMMDA